MRKVPFVLFGVRHDWISGVVSVTALCTLTGLDDPLSAFRTLMTPLTLDQFLMIFFLLTTRSDSWKVQAWNRLLSTPTIQTNTRSPAAMPWQR